uniref:Uncharacterized protein n=1 Tax=Panagrolaimus sp. ES5 TaxID=591445 RepID=A0AC34FGJ2_9BILA
MACPWVHCNICLRLPAANIRYFISNYLITPKCSICKRDAKIEEINKDLREDLRRYFVHIHDLAVKHFNEVKSIIEFQSKNCRRLMRHKVEKIRELQNTTIKHAEDSATIAKLEQQVKELQARNASLETENQTLNSSFNTQQNLVNHYSQLLASNSVANNNVNNAPSFFQSSFNPNMTQQDLFNLVNASYLNASMARSDNSSTMSIKTTRSAPSKSSLNSTTFSARTTQSAPSRSSLYKLHSATADPRSNLRTPQGPSRMPPTQRSRTVCPHWPKARCRCNK